jgi:hypothetical protein
MFCRSLFVFLSFFIWPLCCLSFDLPILITPLVSSNSFEGNIDTGMLKVYYKETNTQSWRRADKYRIKYDLKLYVMKRNFKMWWSTRSAISTKRTITSHGNIDTGMLKVYFILCPPYFRACPKNLDFQRHMAVPVCLQWVQVRCDIVEAWMYFCIF